MSEIKKGDSVTLVRDNVVADILWVERITDNGGRVVCSDGSEWAWPSGRRWENSRSRYWMSYRIRETVERDIELVVRYKVEFNLVRALSDTSRTCFENVPIEDLRAALAALNKLLPTKGVSDER